MKDAEEIWKSLLIHNNPTIAIATIPDIERIQADAIESIEAKYDRLHRILNHIAEHGVDGERMSLIRKWGMSAIGTTPEERVKILIEDAEKDMNRSKPQNTQ